MIPNSERSTEDIPTAGVDFETYYDDECSVKTLGAYGYTHHPDYYAYCVSIVTDDFEWVGDPSEAPWEKIAGFRWVAHNANFDQHVWEREVENHPWLAEHAPCYWEDSAGLSAYLRWPRALGHLVKVAFKTRLNKGVRDRMNGVHFRNLTVEQKAEVLEYALEDSRWMMKFWNEHIHEWPQKERELSRYTLQLSETGLPVDETKIHEAIGLLGQWARDEAEKLPWVRDGSATVASQKALAAALKEAGIPQPLTTEAKSDVFKKWIRKNPGAKNFIEPVQMWRKTNRLLKLFERMFDRVRPDGRLSHELKYAGAHTMRWSGGAGVNVQNQARDAFRGIDVRSIIKTQPGKKLIIADYSQIEPRCLAWVLKDHNALKLMGGGMSPYEVHARQTMGYDLDGDMKDADPKMYALAKARVLALGYGAGAEKFVSMASIYIKPEEFDMLFHEEPTPQMVEDYQRFLEWKDKSGDLNKELAMLPVVEQWEVTNAHKVVMDFRRTNPALAGTKKSCGKDGLWKMLHTALRRSIPEKECTLTLPNGYDLTYFDVQVSSKGTGDILARTERGGSLKHIYGGLMTENLIQAIARGVFAEGLLKLHRLGFKVLFHVHDEIIVEVDNSVSIEDVTQHMIATPDWIAGLPLAVDAVESDHYLK